MTPPARYTTQVYLALIAGMGETLSEIEGAEPYYFQAIHDEAVKVLEKWKHITLTDRDAKRFLRYAQRVFSEIELSLNKPTTVQSIICFMLALATRLWDLSNGNRKLIEPLVDMLEQYAETLGAEKDEYVQRGIEILEDIDEVLQQEYEML